MFADGVRTSQRTRRRQARRHRSLWSVLFSSSRHLLRSLILNPPSPSFTGILRCAAYSGAFSRPLFVPPPPPTSDTSSPPSQPSPPLPPPQDDAISHFHDKLFRLEGLMKTQKGRELARRRTEYMRGFVDEVEREWAEAVGEA